MQVNGRIYSGNNISTSNISNIVVKNIGVGYSAERSFNLVDTSAAIKIVRTHDSFGAILDLHQWNAGITTMLSYWDIVSESGTFSIRDRIGNYTKTNPEISRLFINSYGNVLLGASSNNGLNNIAQSVGYGTDNILQVNGNSYLGGSVGIGTTTPTSKLWVDGDGYFTGILTANRIFSSQYGEFVGGSISGTNIVGTALSITGISTFTNGPVLVGTTTATGTASQPLQVTGGAYVSDNLGIGTTNPTSKLYVVGDGYFTGVVTATSFSGSGTNLTGIVTSIVAGTNITVSGSGQVTINAAGGLDILEVMLFA